VLLILFLFYPPGYYCGYKCSMQCTEEESFHSWSHRRLRRSTYWWSNNTRDKWTVSYVYQ